MKKTKKILFLAVAVCALLFAPTHSKALETLDDKIGNTDWTYQERLNVFNQCLVTALNYEEWSKYLTTPDAGSNMCSCIANEFVERMTYKDFLLVTRIKLREAAIETGRYNKEAIQSSEDKIAYGKVKSHDYEIMRKCANSDVAYPARTEEPTTNQ